MVIDVIKDLSDDVFNKIIKQCETIHNMVVTKTLVETYDSIMAGKLRLTTTQANVIYKIVLNTIDDLMFLSSQRIPNFKYTSISETFATIAMLMEMSKMGEWRIRGKRVTRHTNFTLDEILRLSNSISNNGAAVPLVKTIFDNIKCIKKLNKLNHQKQTGIDTGDNWFIDSKRLPFVINKYNYDIVEPYIGRSEQWMFSKPFTGNYDYFFIPVDSRYSGHTIDSTVRASLLSLSTNKDTVIDIPTYCNAVVQHVLDVHDQNTKDKRDTSNNEANNSLYTFMSNIKPKLIESNSEFNYIYDVLNMSGIDLSPREYEQPFSQQARRII